MFPRMDDYNASAKAYWWTTAIVGAIALALALKGVAAMPRGAILQIAFGTFVAGLTGAFPIRVPGSKTSITGAELVIFLLLLLYGPEAAAVAAAAEAAVGSWRTSTRWTSRLGSPAMAGLAMYACGTAFADTVDFVARHSGAPTLAVLVLLLLCLALAYFAAGTLLMASLITLKAGQPLRPLQILRDHLWLALVYCASAAIAGLIYVGYDKLGAGIVLAAIPVIAVVLLTHRLYLGHLEATEQAKHAAERQAAEATRHLADLQKSESRFQNAFSHAAIGMALVTDDRYILQANPALCEILGRSAQQLMGSDFSSFIHADDVHFLTEGLSTLASSAATTCSLELRCARSDRKELLISLHASLFTASEADAPCLIFQVQDITARRQAETRLQHIANHDDLTGLPNRAHFFDQLTRAVRAVKHDPDFRFAVLFLDFDRFKTINDSLGHRAGDDLLVVLAKRIAAQLRPTDVVARLGGDEFAILVRNLRHEREAIALADRLQSVVREPVRLHSGEVSTSVSIGITVSAFDYESPDDVMRDADIAMYRAKAQGRAQYALFDSGLHADVSSQLEMESALRRALDQAQLNLVYQPIFDLRTRQVTGVETLCRWTHPERGAVPPERFIRVAEETGMIVQLGAWVLEQACRQLSAWQKSVPGVSSLLLHVNVSVVQLVQPGFAQRVKEIIERAKLKPAQVALEVTESVLIDRLSAALPNLRQLREYGVQISIDDFGTGYSSFGSMVDLPIGEIKIDRSFVNRLARSGEGEEVVRAIIAMGHAIGKRVVAEGIETEPQQSKLVELGCEGGQGYLLARPLAPWDVETMLKEPRLHTVAA